MTDTCNCGGRLRCYSTRRTGGRYGVRYFECLGCGSRSRLIVPVDEIRHRTRAAKSVRCGDDSTIPAVCAGVEWSEPQQEHGMSKREQILAALDKLTSDRQIAELRREIAELRALIDADPIRQAERRIVEAARLLESREHARTARMIALEDELRTHEPRIVEDVRQIVRTAFEKFQQSDPPITTVRRGEPNQLHAAWWRRGERLAEVCQKLRQLWSERDPLAALRSIVDEYRDIPELSHVYIPEEAEHVEA